MAQLQKDLKEFVELLIANEVEFLVVGAYAVAFHGHVRNTQDLDFFIRSSQANAEKMTVLIEEFGFESLGLTAEDFYDPSVVIQLGYPPNRIDIITEIDGVTFEEAWGSRVAGPLDGLNVAYIGREDLIRNKITAGRAKDLADANALARG